MELQPFIDRLTAFVGEEEARRAFGECLQEAALHTAETPGEVLALAACLIRRGGVAHLVGRALRAKAIEAGAFRAGS